MNKYFYVGESVTIRRTPWFRREVIETGKVVGLPDDNHGCYIVQRTRTGDHLKISHENLLEEKVWRPWRMGKATERGG